MKRNHLLTATVLCLALAAASLLPASPGHAGKNSRRTRLAERSRSRTYGAEHRKPHAREREFPDRIVDRRQLAGDTDGDSRRRRRGAGAQHHGIDQFLRVEEGTARVMMGDSGDNLDFVREVSDDYAILVPAGKWHNIVNTGRQTAENLFDLRSGGTSPRHGPQDPARGHGGRTPPLAEQPAVDRRRVCFFTILM